MSGQKQSGGSGSTRFNRVQLVRGGTDYFNQLYQLIDSSEKLLYLQFYIFEDDETGNAVAEVLLRAAQRGVQVFVMADGFASRHLSQLFIDKLRQAGIHFRFFDPLLKSKHFYFGRRLHHKVAVADSRYALVGGINITNRYNDFAGQKAWLDFAVYVEGEAAQQLCLLSWKTWSSFPSVMQTSPCDLLAAFPVNEECEVAMRRNDWVKRKNEISSSYVDMLRHARTQVTILCSYFLPGRVIRKQLAEASKRGVHVRVITAGYSDVGIVKYAERFIYKWLLRQNILIYEYQPAVLHGKIAVCDCEWVTVGSYNINNLSAYASIELNLDIHNASFAGKTEALLEQIIKQDCKPVTGTYQSERINLFQRFARWISYGFINFIFYLSTFYYRHKV